MAITWSWTHNTWEQCTCTWSFSPLTEPFFSSTGTLQLTRLLSQKGRLCEGILRIRRGSSDAGLQNTLAYSEESTASPLTKLSPTSCWNFAVYSVPYHFLSIKSPASLSCAQYALQQKGSEVFLQFILKEIYSGMLKTPFLNITAGIQKSFFSQFSSGPGKDRLITLPQNEELKLSNFYY